MRKDAKISAIKKLKKYGSYKTMIRETYNGFIHGSEEDRCFAEEFVKSLPVKDRNKPIHIFCPCSRCTPRM